MGRVLGFQRGLGRRAETATLLIVLAPVSTTSGCILGSDDYGLTPTGGAGGAPPLPELPARPDPVRGDDCTACVAAECETEQNACLADPRCTDMLRCKGICSNPACLVDCEDTLPPSLLFSNYFACAFDTYQLHPTDGSLCPEACGAPHAGATNWACAGEYSWLGRNRAIDVGVRVRQLGAPGQGPLASLKGATLAPCTELAVARPDLQCDHAAEVVLDGYGFAQIAIDGADSTFAITSLAGEVHRVFPRPLVQSGTLDLWVPSLLADNYYGVLILPNVPGVDRALGVVFVNLFDCLGEVNISDPVTLVPSEGVIPEPAPADFASRMFFNVPPGRVTVSFALDGTERASRSIDVQAGALTTVDVYPLDSSALAR